MKKSTLSLGLALGIYAIFSLPVTAKTSPPNVSPDNLQTLTWIPLTVPVNHQLAITSTSPQIRWDNMRGGAAAFTLPANRGALEITLSSFVTDKIVFAPNIMVLDEQQHPAAFYASDHFTYQKPNLMQGERLEGSLKLTPALGQKRIHLLIYTTQQDLEQTTTLTAPAKAYATGVGNAAPNIPDPIVKHSEIGQLQLDIKAEQSNDNVVIGTPANLVPIAVDTGKKSSILPETEAYFNQKIKEAVKANDIEKAMALMNEAENLGSSSAKTAFISSVKNKG